MKLLSYPFHAIIVTVSNWHAVIITVIQVKKHLHFVCGLLLYVTLVFGLISGSAFLHTKAHFTVYVPICIAVIL